MTNKCFSNSNSSIASSGTSAVLSVGNGDIAVSPSSIQSHDFEPTTNQQHPPNVTYTQNFPSRKFRSRVHASNFRRSQLNPLFHSEQQQQQQQQQQADYLNEVTRRCVSADAVLTPSATEYAANATPFSQFMNGSTGSGPSYRNASFERPAEPNQYQYPPSEGNRHDEDYYFQRGQQHQSQSYSRRVLSDDPDQFQESSLADVHVHWRGQPVRELLGAYITSQGFITFRLRNNIWLDLTIDKAIRIVNYESKVIMALSACGTMSGFIHPSGVAYQYCAVDPESATHDTRIELCTNEKYGPQKYAKLNNKGITFSGDDHALIYVVDQAGTRSTSSTFSDLFGDFCLPIFLNTSTHGPIAINECGRLLQAAQFWTGPEGTENWIINGIRIAQEPDGSLRVARDSLRYQLRTNPRNGNGSISTPQLHCSASVDGHLLVRRGSKRVHFDGRQLIARNGSHSSGFDFQNRLKLF